MTGTVVFSVDAELSWGLHDLHPLTEAQRTRCRQARERWMQLLGLFDTFDVRATWAVVGHLLTDDPQYRDCHPLPETWFRTADEGIEHRPEEWLGRDLIDAVATSPVGHELGSHSFSHAIFTDVGADVAAAECQLSREIGDQYGFEFRSFVFPRNRIAHRRVLADHGFECYRGLQPNGLPAVPGLRGLGLLAGSLTGRVTPPPVTPSVDEFGLVTVPASVFLGGFRGQPWSGLAALYGDPVVKLVRRGIDRAIENGSTFHLWLHPHDLTDPRYVDRVRETLAYVAMKREHGDVRVETMGEVAASHSSDAEASRSDPVRSATGPPASER